jgi:hypothetical protein
MSAPRARVAVAARARIHVSRRFRFGERGGATPRAERAKKRREQAREARSASEGEPLSAMRDGYAEYALRVPRWALRSAPRAGLRHDKAVWEA